MFHIFLFHHYFLKMLSIAIYCKNISHWRSLLLLAKYKNCASAGWSELCQMGSDWFFIGLMFRWYYCKGNFGFVTFEATYLLLLFFFSLEATFLPDDLFSSYYKLETSTVLCGQSSDHLIRCSTISIVVIGHQLYPN